MISLHGQRYSVLGLEMVATDGSVRIENKERIRRILTKICDAGLQVMIRPVTGGKLVVRGRADGLQDGAIVISQISDQGVRYLNGSTQVNIEFRGMTTQLSFDGIIRRCGGHELIVGLPDVLMSLERRKNARYVTHLSLPAFVKVGSWVAKSSDLASPPIVPHFAELSSWIRLADLSASGLCLTTRFPGASTVLARGAVEESASLILPMQAPLDLSFTIRWARKLRETTQVDASRIRVEKHYRIGVEFCNPSPEVINSLRAYVQQLSLVEAV